MKQFTQLIAMCALGACGTVTQYEPPLPYQNSPQVNMIANWMAGSYSSAAQSQADPEYKHIVLHMKPIWTDQPNGRWLYVEQAMQEAADKPYRQRVYHLVHHDDGAVESLVFELPGDALQYAGAWKQDQPLNQLLPSQLTPRSGCGVKLKAKSTTQWSGSTDGDMCASSLRGAAYATSEVTVTESEITSWDRGFDSAGKQVWGATKGPYQFKKQTQ